MRHFLWEVVESVSSLGTLHLAEYRTCIKKQYNVFLKKVSLCSLKHRQNPFCHLPGKLPNISRVFSNKLHVSCFLV